MIPFEERLASLIKHLDLTPTRFAELHGVGRASIHKMLNGETKPGLDTIERICLANPKISAEYLIRGEGFPLIGLEVKMEKPVERNETMRLLFDLQAQINRMFVEKVNQVDPLPSHSF